MQQSDLKIHLIGPFRVVVQGREIPAKAWTGRRSRSLVKLLALSPPGRSVDELIEILWPDTMPARARSRLYEAASRVRRTLIQARGDVDAARYAPDDTSSAYPPNDGPGSTAPGSERWPIASCRSGYQLAAPVWVDLQNFHEQVAHLRSLYANDRVSALDLALRLTPPPPEHVLVEDAYEDWAASARERVREEALAVYRMRAQLLLERERDTEALETLLQLLALDPICEQTAGRAMKLALNIGDRETALAVFTRLRDTLREEVGVQPARQTMDVYRLIASGTAPARPVEPGGLHATSTE